MNVSRLRIVLALCALLAAPTSTIAQVAPQFRDRIETIASGQDGSMRRAAITRQLDTIGVPYQLEEFTLPKFSGVNILVDIPAASGSSKTLLLGAHYDRVDAGTGAVDNSSGCAILLGLLADLKAKPLQNYAVRVVFFDLEERGLVGSQAYFAKPRYGGSPAAAVNLDIFAYGDTMFGVASEASGRLASALQTAAREAAMPLRLISDRNRYPASDHRIMMTAGIETLGLAIIDGTEIDSILQPGAGGGAPPPIFSIIHSNGDVIDRVRPADMEKAFTVIKQMIDLVDLAN